MSLNKVLLIGNVGRDPEVRHLESGAAVASFTLATTERYKDKTGMLQDQTEWHNIVCWRNLADLVEKYVNKGSQIFIEGKIRTRSWTDQTGQKRYTTEIIADNIRLLGRRGDTAAPSGNYGPQQGPGGYAQNGSYGNPGGYAGGNMQNPQQGTGYQNGGYPGNGGYGAPQSNQNGYSHQPESPDFQSEDGSDDLPF